MTFTDLAKFAWHALWGYRLRTWLMILATAIGVAAVIVLTSLGEGARRYVRNEFEALGTNIMMILPGRAETTGGMAGIVSGRTPRDLTLDDAMALQRIRGVYRVAPVNLVAGEVSANGRRRDVPVIGTTEPLYTLWNLSMAQGSFLPKQDPRQATWVCVIGANIRRELFGAQPALGQWVRVGDRRFRVIGVLAQRGEMLGLDVDEVVIMPVATAQITFNLTSLLRLGIETYKREEVQRVKQDVLRVLADRHGGEQDVTILTEDAVAKTFDRILLALTLALGGIASISLAVAGILIMNVMLIAVSQRTSEIGLLKAIGASPSQIRGLFFAEAIVLAGVGGIAGSVLGQIGSAVIREIYPAIPAYAPVWAVIAALVTAIVTGVAFSILPARRAAALDPALALNRR